ncbi:MAG: class I SAM-dependent methyltransferase [DPANN group archaeon]|nr:class I SAM-dependent methyltransferase [DPANN group archaeon]
MAKSARVRQDYNLSVDSYDSRYREIQFEKFRIMLSGIELKEPILDLGCGTGLLREFLGRKVKLFGCDFSEKMLEKAKARGEIVSVCDLNKKFPYENDFFNTVLSFTVLQNVKDVNNFLKEAKRILKKDGIFVLTTLKKTTNEKKLIKLIEKYFVVQEITDCGEDVGFILNANE